MDRWIRLEELPERQTMAAKFCTPAYFREYLSRRWAEGCTHAGRLFEEIKRLGYCQFPLKSRLTGEVNQ